MVDATIEDGHLTSYPANGCNSPFIKSLSQHYWFLKAFTYKQQLPQMPYDI